MDGQFYCDLRQKQAQSEPRACCESERRVPNTPPQYNLRAMKYCYWTVICSTPTCSKRHFVKFIGEDQGTNKFPLEGDLPVTFFHQCETCGKVHTYTPADLLRYSINPPRLHGLREWW